MLIDAEPRYVSIVDHAANLTPFKDVKMEEPAVVENKDETVCKKELNFTTGSVVKEFVFGSAFKSEQDVKDYMEQNNWKGYSISKVEGGFIAAGAMTVFQGVNIILGAYVGTTVTGLIASLSEMSSGW